jgi:hypothetical protein
MTPAKLNVFFAFFSYAGNGGVSCEHPSLRSWFARTLLQCKEDARVENIMDKDFSDTPITMTRNDAVWKAQQAGADLLVMVDSDQYPDWELIQGDHQAKEWWPTTFDFIYQRFSRGLLTAVGAPYCGPPPCENVYVFRFANWQSDNPNQDLRVEGFSREEAAQRSGFEAVAALPTGLIAYDMRIFDLLDPPYFYYEWSDKYQRQKASTEDVTNTRDIVLHCLEAKGYNPVFVNWDSWAGHWKPKCVGKPRPLSIHQIGENYRAAVLRNQDLKNDRLIILGEEGIPVPSLGANGR